MCVHMCVTLYTYKYTVTAYACIYYTYTHYLQKDDKVTINSTYI